MISPLCVLSCLRFSSQAVIIICCFFHLRVSPPFTWSVWWYTRKTNFSCFLFLWFVSLKGLPRCGYFSKQEKQEKKKQNNKRQHVDSYTFQIFVWRTIFFFFYTLFRSLPGFYFLGSACVVLPSVFKLCFLPFVTSDVFTFFSFVIASPIGFVLGILLLLFSEVWFWSLYYLIAKQQQ